MLQSVKHRDLCITSARYCREVVGYHFCLSFGFALFLTIFILLHSLCYHSWHLTRTSVLIAFLFAQAAGFFLEHSWSGETLRFYSPPALVVLVAEVMVNFLAPVSIEVHFVIATSLLVLQNVIFVLLNDAKSSYSAIFKGSFVLCVLLFVALGTIRLVMQSTNTPVYTPNLLVFLAVLGRFVLRLLFSTLFTRLICAPEMGSERQGGFDFLVLYSDIIFAVFAVMDIPVIACVLSMALPHSLLCVLLLLVSDILFVYIESRVTHFQSTQKPGIMNHPRPLSPIHCAVSRIIDDPDEIAALLIKNGALGLDQRPWDQMTIDALHGNRHNMEGCQRLRRLFDEYDDHLFSSKDEVISFEYQRRKITYQQHLFATTVCATVAPLGVVTDPLQLVTVAVLFLFKVGADLLSWKSVYVPDTVSTINDRAWTGNFSAWSFRLCTVGAVLFTLIP